MPILGSSRERGQFRSCGALWWGLLGATAYRNHLKLGVADVIAPLAAPAVNVRVSEMLP